MGIGSLATYVVSEPSLFKQELIKGLTVVYVDGDAFVNFVSQRLYAELPFKDLAKARRELGEVSFREFVTALHSVNERVVFVFDDASYELKMEKKEDRKKQKKLGELEVERRRHFFHENPNKEYNWVSSGETQWFEFKNAYMNQSAPNYLYKEVSAVLRNDLVTMGIEIVVADEEEADYELVLLHRGTPGSCILSEDTDFCVYPGVLDYRTLSNFDHKTLQADRWDVAGIVSHITKKWKLVENTFIFIMMLCKSDYVPYKDFIEPIRRAGMPRKVNKEMSWVAHTLQYFGGLTLEEIETRLRSRCSFSRRMIQRVHDAVNVYMRRDSQDPPALAYGRVRQAVKTKKVDVDDGVLGQLETGLAQLAVSTLDGDGDRESTANIKEEPPLDWEDQTETMLESVWVGKNS